MHCVGKSCISVQSREAECEWISGLNQFYHSLQGGGRLLV